MASVGVEIGWGIKGRPAEAGRPEGLRDFRRRFHALDKAFQFIEHRLRILDVAFDDLHNCRTGNGPGGSGIN